MPIVVVAAIAAGGAVAAGVVAASAVVYAGIAVSVVGKVTKSKELSQIGSGMSLGAGIASAATSIFGATEGGIASGAGAENVVPTPTGVDSAAGSLGGEAAAGTIDAGTTAGLGDSAANGVDAASSAAESSGGLLNPAAPESLSTTPAASTPPVASAPSSPSAVPFEDGFVGTDVALSPPPATDSNSIAQWWAKQPDSIKSRILQTGAQAAGGLFEGWTSEQKLALQREQLNLAQNQADISRANANAQPRVAFKPYTPATGGLLNPAKG